MGTFYGQSVGNGQPSFGATEFVGQGLNNMKIATPSFSVILCVHRKNPWFNDAIDSILEQEDPDFEFLIGANACTDDFWSELEQIASRDTRIRLSRTRIGQLSFNLNYLANLANGEYLVRMDADDISEPNRLSVLRQSLNDMPVDILGSAATLIDREGKSVGKLELPETQKAIEKALINRTCFCHPTVALRRQFLLDIRGYLGGYASEDTDLWLRARRAGATMRNLPDPLLRYRVHEQQSIGSREGYAEVAGHWLRELLLVPSWSNFRGFIIAFGKVCSAPMLPGIAGYKQKRSKEIDHHEV